MKICTTCNKIVTNQKTEFKCPSCGKSEIIRCQNCREAAKPYICPECGFEGP